MPEWAATLICPDDDFDGAPLLRCEFGLDAGHGPVQKATLHATAHGVFEAHLIVETIMGLRRGAGDR